MTLTEYARIIQKRWMLVLAILVLGCTAAVTIGPSISEPHYTATSKLIVNKSFSKTDDPLSQADLQLNMMLIGTYRELVKSAPILDKVMTQNPDLRLTAEEWGTSLKVGSTAGSQIMSLSWTDRSYERASRTVNAITNVFKAELPLLMRVDNVRVLSESNPASQPPAEQVGMALLLLIGFVCSAVLALLAAFLLETVSPRMEDPGEVEKTLGIPVLATILETKGSELKSWAPAASITSKRVGDEPSVHLNG